MNASVVNPSASGQFDNTPAISVLIPGLPVE